MVTKLIDSFLKERKNIGATHKQVMLETSVTVSASIVSERCTKCADRGTNADWKYFDEKTTKAKLLESSQDRSAAMQFGEVLLSSPACINTHISGSLSGRLIFIVLH